MDLHSIPAKSGIYVVSLKNDIPISVNADRPKIAERCIKVNKENCKFGKAVNLARRHRDYIKTFGADNVVFNVIAVTGKQNEIETALKGHLAEFRIRGKTGHLNEWLKGISVEEVEKIARQVADDIITKNDLDKSQPLHTQKNEEPVADMSVLNYSEVNPKNIVKALIYLEGVKMPVERLRDLHHFENRTETFAKAIKYFSERMDITGVNNQIYGKRLMYVEKQHRDGRHDFSTLATEAINLFVRP